MLKNKIKKIVIFLVSLAFILPPVWAGMTLLKIDASSTISDLRRQLDESQAAIAHNANQRRAYDREIAEARNAQRQSAQTKEYYDRLIMTILNEIDEQENRIKLQEELLELTAYRIQATEADYEQNYQLFLELLHFTYTRGRAGNLELFLRADNLSDLLTRIDRMASMANYTRDILTNLQSDRTEIEQSRAAHEESNSQLEIYKRELSERTAEFKDKQDEIDVYINSLNLTIAQAEEEQRRIDSDSQAIESQVAQTIRDIQAREAAANQQRAYVGGRMGWPVNTSFNIITSPFGTRVHPITGRSEFHRGTDISGGGINGTPIRAANDGTVIISQWSGSYGLYIVIDHGAGHTTLYSHASQLLKSVGDAVTQGETIALVGSTGWSTGPHLHFEVAINGNPTNPMDGWIVRP